MEREPAKNDEVKWMVICQCGYCSRETTNALLVIEWLDTHNEVCDKKTTIYKLDHTHGEATEK